jgi:hypothetical protein
MRPQDIKIGEYYRHKSTPNYGWAKTIKVLKPHEGKNILNHIIVECEWTVSKGDLFGLIKYFKPSDLIKAVNKSWVLGVSMKDTEYELSKM